MYLGQFFCCSIHVYATVEKCCPIFSRVVCGHSLDLYKLLIYNQRYSIKSKEEGKDQESRQFSTTPDP